MSPAVAQSLTGYSAWVSTQEARFFFPLPDVGQWEWNRAEMEPGRREHQWEVWIENEGQRYGLGFSQFRFPGAPPAYGDLSDLLEGGQLSFWIPRADGRLDDDNGVEVEVAPLGDHIVVRLRDPDAIKRLFSGRPMTIMFQSLIAGGEPREELVPVTYASSDELPQQLAAPWPGEGGMMLGDVAPEFALDPLIRFVDERTELHPLSAYRGEVLLLYVWGGTCAPSKREYPELVDFVGIWSKRGVRVVGVVLSGEAKAGDFIEENGGAQWPHLIATANFRREYSVSGTPSIVVIDPDGRVAHHAFGTGQLKPELILTARLERLVGSYRH